MGMIDADGYLYLSDRQTDMILAGGANIYPAEIEAALDEHPRVRSCAVIGLPDDDLGNRVHAIVQTDDGTPDRRRRAARPTSPSGSCATRSRARSSSRPSRCATTPASSAAPPCGAERLRRYDWPCGCRLPRMVQSLVSAGDRHGHRRLRRLRRRQPLLRGHRRVHPAPAASTARSSCSGPSIDGKQRMVVDSKVFRFIPNPTFDPVARPGCLDEYFRGKQAGDDIRDAFGELEPINPAYREPEARVKLMDTQGIEGCFLFPTLGVGVEEALLHDPGALHDVFHAFNEWMLDDWTFNYRDRIYAAPYIALQDPQRAEQEVEYALANGAHVVVMRAGPVRGPGFSRSPGRPDVRRRVGAARRGRHPRRVPLGRRGLQPLRRRVGRRRRLPGVPQRPVPQRHVRAPADLRHDRRARVPRRAAPAPEPARRDDRERLGLGAAAAEGVEEVVRAAARRVRARRPGRAGARARVGVAVLRGRPARAPRRARRRAA